MKKAKIILALVLVMIFTFSVTAFATGDTEVYGGEAVQEGDVFNYEYDDGVYEEESFEDVFGEDSGSILALSFVMVISMMLFFPALVVMIIFIVMNNKTANKIRAYELAYGVVFTKDVINDMKNIPPQNYNYNPGAFVPQYPSQNMQNVNTTAPQSSFNSTLYEEVKNTNENNGGDVQ